MPGNADTIAPTDHILGRELGCHLVFLEIPDGDDLAADIYHGQAACIGRYDIVIQAAARDFIGSCAAEIQAVFGLIGADSLGQCIEGFWHQRPVVFLFRQSSQGKLSRQQVVIVIQCFLGRGRQIAALIDLGRPVIPLNTQVAPDEVGQQQGPGRRCSRGKTHLAPPHFLAQVRITAADE